MKTQLTWKQLTSLEVGGAICLPVIMVGHAVCQRYGFSSAIAAICLGNMMLYILACIAVMMSFETKMPTAENAISYFGEKGTVYFSLALLVAKGCWFALQLNMMTFSIIPILPEAFTSSAGHVLINLLLGVAIICVALKGIRAISLLSTYSMPILVGTMAYALYLVKDQVAVQTEHPFRWEGTSLIIATAITAVIDMPTYFRHAKSRFDGMFAAAMFLLISVPLIEGVGVYLSAHHGTGNIVDTLFQEGHPYWNSWITLFLLLAGWTTNNTNLYSATTCLGTLLPHYGEKKRTVLVGGAATVVALFEILNYFTGILQLLGMAIGTMGIVILVSYLLNKLKKGNPQFSIRNNLIGWFLGLLFGLLSLLEFVAISTIPLIDGCLWAAIITVGGHFFSLKKINHKENDDERNDSRNA